MSYNTSNPKIEKNRKKIRAKRGTAVNFELSARKTNNHFYLTVYDCIQAKEVFTYSTLNMKERKNNVESAGVAGTEVAKWCLENKVPAVYFNKLHYKFHGKLEAAMTKFNETFNK